MRVCIISKIQSLALGNGTACSCRLDALGMQRTLADKHSDAQAAGSSTSKTHNVALKRRKSFAFSFDVREKQARSQMEPHENDGPAPSAADYEARRAVTSLLEEARAFASASSDEALSACSNQLSKLIDELAQGKRAVRQQGSQASTATQEDSAQTTRMSSDAAAQVQPTRADEGSQAGVVLRDGQSQASGRPALAPMRSTGVVN